MPTEEYLSLAIREFQRLKRLGDRAIAQVPADRFLTKPGDSDNCIGVIVKHVSGNLLSRWTDFLSSDGEKPGRRRDNEFIILPEDSREGLLARWEEGWAVLFKNLGPLGSSNLGRSVTIRGEPVTVLQAVNQGLTHCAYHIGQIVYLAKHFAGARWKSLSIPLGESERYNQASRKKAETGGSAPTGGV